MYDRCMKLKKPLLIMVAVVLLLTLLKSLSVEPLAHVVAPSSLDVEQIEWESCTQTDDHSWEYVYQMPNLISADEVLCLMSKWVNVNVYIDDRVIFRFDDSDMVKGTSVHWIKLPLWAVGKRLHVVYSGASGSVVTSSEYKAYYGKAAMVYLKFLIERAYAVVYSLCAALMISLIAYFYRLLKRQMDRNMKCGLIDLELFLITSMVWVICDSKIVFVLWRNVGVATLLSYVTLLLFPMFLMMFINRMVGERIKVIAVMPVIYSVVFLLVGAGYLTGLVPLKQSLLWIHVLLVASAFACIWGVSAALRRNRAKEMNKIMMGFCAMVVLGIVAIICYRMVPTVTYSLYVCAGLFLFALLLIWAAYDRLYDMMGRQAKAMAYRRLAYRDVMTNLGNRAAFMKAQEELTSVVNVGMVVMDINDLKYTNDKYGHQAGDEMIRCAAQCISATFAEKGNIYRIGGDEFVVILPDASEVLMYQMIDQLDLNIRENSGQSGQSWTLHIACGWAVGDKWKNAEELFKQADDLMYEHKHKMKNDRDYREAHMQEKVLESSENEEKVMGHKQLENNLIDLIIEEQAKLGYRKETIRLYYPLQSLRHFYGCSDSADEMQERLGSFPQEAAAQLGAVEITHVKDRFCFKISEEGVEYVHTHRSENEFIRQLVDLLTGHASLDDVRQLFRAQPYASTATELDNGEFDLLIRFTEGDDPYYYCFKDEGCHVIYHRFLPEDYNDFDF